MVDVLQDTALAEFAAKERFGLYLVRNAFKEEDSCSFMTSLLETMRYLETVSYTHLTLPTILLV